MKSALPLLIAIALLSSKATAQSTCAAAVDIGPGIHTVSTLVGTAPPAYCIGAAPAAPAAAWYKYTPVQDTVVNITTRVPGYPDVDTRFHVYSGSCGSLVCVGGDDDSGPNYTSVTTLSVQGGVAVSYTHLTLPTKRIV